MLTFYNRSLLDAESQHPQAIFKPIALDETHMLQNLECTIIRFYENLDKFYDEALKYQHHKVLLKNLFSRTKVWSEQNYAHTQIVKRQMNGPGFGVLLTAKA